MATTMGNVSFATATADTLVKTGPGRVRSVFIEGGSSVHWRLRNGTDATGAIIGDFPVGSGAAAFDWGVQFDEGLFLDLVGGTTPTISVLFE